MDDSCVEQNAHITDESNLPPPLQINADDFTRRFSLRAGSLMWLLGAGASASAGIPTAWNMVWDFKQQLFISQRRVSSQAVADLSNPLIRDQLQAHIDSSENLPSFGDPDEYAALFEAVYPSEADRRYYLEAKIGGAKLSYGHVALATLMRAQLTWLVWTTNFDPLVADACAKVYGSTGALTTLALDSPELAAQAINEGRWPIEVKLHGDFQSRRLKNTTDELRYQDRQLRSVLIDSCRRFGLVVAGYSGRDDSIMTALEEVLEHDNPFPNGLFWLHRGESPPSNCVEQLLRQAVAKGVDAALVVVENFDETLRDLVRLIDDLDTTVLEDFATESKRCSGAPRPEGRQGWPVVRLNALPVLQKPSVCRRVLCDIGGYREVREAVEQSGVDILATRTRAGVLAFGTDEDVRKAFDPYEITDFDLHTIEFRRLRYDSGERGLLRAALTQALMKNHNLNCFRRRSVDLLAPASPQDTVWNPLREQVGKLEGVVKDWPELRWREGIGARLDWADERLWLLIEPRIVFSGLTSDNKAAASDFARERSVKRYNLQLNNLINFWAKLLSSKGDELQTLDISVGVDAVFRLSSETGFSARVQA